MSAHALTICLMLAAEVDGRYGNGATQPNPFTPPPAAAANPTAGSDSPGSSIVPIDADVGSAPAASSNAPPASNRTIPTATPAGIPAASPYQPNSQLNAGRGDAKAPIGARAQPITGGAASGSTPDSQYPWNTTQEVGGRAPTNTSGELKPSGMMRAMLNRPATSQLSGSFVRLSDVVTGARSRFEQTERVEAYWDLCSSVADYYLGLREQEELRNLQSQSRQGGPPWQQIESELAVRTATAQAAAIASQHRLASLIGAAGILPLPADIPHCGDYNTKYDQIFSERPSIEAQQLANLLPLRYAELKDAATAVSRAEEWLNSTAASSTNRDGAETRSALELLALRRRAFVQIGRDYNRRIARYAELSKPGPVGAELLVSMLIKPANVRTATGEPLSSQQSEVAPALPKTFVNEWTPAGDEQIGDAELDRAIQPASAESEPDESAQGERSLLVEPPSDPAAEAGTGP